MTPDRVELARRAVACKGWRWLPGMRWTNPPKPGGYGPLDGAGRLDETEATYLWPPDGAVPDLGDPATVGCLLALVREAFGTDQMHVYYATCAGDWVVHHPDPPRGRGPTSVRGRTEAETLLAALEAAP